MHACSEDLGGKKNALYAGGRLLHVLKERDHLLLDGEVHDAGPAGPVLLWACWGGVG